MLGYPAGTLAPEKNASLKNVVEWGDDLTVGTLYDHVRLIVVSGWWVSTMQVMTSWHDVLCCCWLLRVVIVGCWCGQWWIGTCECGIIGWGEFEMGWLDVSVWLVGTMVSDGLIVCDLGLLWHNDRMVSWMMWLTGECDAGARAVSSRITLIGVKCLVLGRASQASCVAEILPD